MNPFQVCFIVDDVPTAVKYCEDRFGWGPFHQFKASVMDARYKSWRGEKLTEVALGMAGRVQVELLHVHKGCDTTADYEAEYGTGFQHLGIRCKSREEVLTHLQSLGAVVNEVNEYPGVRFAFVDVPTGPGMLEILQPTTEMASNRGVVKSSQSNNPTARPLFEIDRATLVTRNMDSTLSFYASAFGWDMPKASEATLRCSGEQTTVQRYIGQAGALQLEFIETDGTADDPYSAHLRRGSHGLVHASGMIDGELPHGEALLGDWAESNEIFALYDWMGGECALQIRQCN